MEEAIRSMLLKLNHPGYLVDFSVEETAIFDPVTERDYFPVKIEAKKVEGFVVKGGQYFPPDEKGMRALALFLWDDDEEEDEDDIYGYHTADDMEDVCVSDVCVRYLVQKKENYWNQQTKLVSQLTMIGENILAYGGRVKLQCVHVLWN
ncbi:uncharacterized protein LOC9654047 isoform X2 [Selaginella moellendorffii]|uniref:uncharacterized protein LOC9634308 isoform X2 n=1 Tax=Selaginella moellendorffii TaxID=88036 RepID=UPI000D1C853F|nr:uncharacterized protein LOC9634308 isoform X2 [Selaginella moellendorffii]XP_024543955.1 uncharacterized protein LOC9654047 isoform X2 [Selaginella moellendorffii]|eukprot:XP_024526363.1 uncharacterized protein LOC9634308 isoform X2 [Selaginella moellendorffii]